MVNPTMVPVCVLHVPHTSAFVPQEARPSLAVSDEQLGHELLVSTDWFTDELFSLPRSRAVAVQFPVSRLVLDPERFVDDADEPMARLGRGVVYTSLADGQPLREALSAAVRDELLARYYHPHHAILSTAVSAARRDQGACLLIDCHSFPSTPLPCDLDQLPARPDVCLGTDSIQTPSWLLDLARRSFEECGFSVSIDRPYAGVLIPLEHSGQNTGVYALMIEINRRLYMDETSGAKSQNFKRVHESIQGVLLGLIQETEGRAPA